MKPLIQVFFAIPCGKFYETQCKIITRLCDAYNIEPIINEKDLLTESLLDQILDQITKCDYFIADISSGSQNVIFELGYALKAKHRSKIAILLSNISKCPSDLYALKRLQYESYKEYATKLNNWLSQFFKESHIIDDQGLIVPDYYEAFNDQDLFLKKWDTPLGCDYSLTFNGFRFSNAHLPVLSKHLAFLQDYIFEFECLINRSTIGWVVNGTKFNFEDSLIDFCVMFNLSTDGHLTPHIFSKKDINPKSHYHVFDGLIIKETINYKERLNIKTSVHGSIIKIEINDIKIYQQDLSHEPFDKYYNSIDNKTNQIGFRCHPGEEATVYSVKVASMTEDDKSTLLEDELLKLV